MSNTSSSTYSSSEEEDEFFSSTEMNENSSTVSLTPFPIYIFNSGWANTNENIWGLFSMCIYDSSVLTSTDFSPLQMIHLRHYLEVFFSSSSSFSSPSSPSSSSKERNQRYQSNAVFELKTTEARKLVWSNVLEFIFKSESPNTYKSKFLNLYSRPLPQIPFKTPQRNIWDSYSILLPDVYDDFKGKLQLSDDVKKIFIDLLCKDVCLKDEKRKWSQTFLLTTFNIGLSIAKYGFLDAKKLESIKNDLEISHGYPRKVLLNTVEEYGKLFQELVFVSFKFRLNLFLVYKRIYQEILSEEPHLLDYLKTVVRPRSLSGVIVILDAMKSYPNLPLWNFLHVKCFDEFENWKKALRLLSNLSYSLFLKNSFSPISENLFPNLLYAGKQILIHYGRQNKGRRLRTEKKPSKYLVIDDLIAGKALSLEEKYRFKKYSNLFEMYEELLEDSRFL